jgi:hypothetical protein
MRIFLLSVLLLCFTSVAAADPPALHQWTPSPDHFSGHEVLQAKATLSSGNWSMPQANPGQWAFLVSPNDAKAPVLEATLQIEKPASQFGFFGQSWSVWPDPTFGDGGFDAAALLSDGEKQGYRIQVSHKYGSVALVKFPSGGYLRSVPCDIPVGKPIRLSATKLGTELIVLVDGEEKIRYTDHAEHLNVRTIGVGVSSLSTVQFTDVKVTSNQDQARTATTNATWWQSHQPDFRVVQWLGDRPWLFDGEEPIMLLPVPEAKYINNVKLRPGIKPLLSWNSHWGIENQGAFADGENVNSPITRSGGGKTINVSWTAKQKEDRFETRTTMAVSYDNHRGVYVYDIDSELDVLGKEPFHFRYGYDFEHHTPLDPFGWQYLLIRDAGGELTYRPLSPFDPGPLDDVQQYYGARAWHGRSQGDVGIAPAVEYFIQPEWQQVADGSGGFRQRQLNTAVCAAFYDTGVAFQPEIAKPGDKVRVKYRYTGYPASESASLFKTAKVQDNPRIDPEHHFVFARDQWPTIRFEDALPMDKPWWGGRPFLSGHNARPTYASAEVDGRRVLRLGPVSYGVAPVGPSPVQPGRYLVTAKVKSVNTHGPGGRIEVLALKKADTHGNNFLRHDSGNILTEVTYLLGKGSFDWQEVRYVVEIPEDAAGLALGLGNSGTGEVFVSEVAFKEIRNADEIATSAARPDTLGSRSDSPASSLWDLRMEEQDGHYVYNHGASTHRTLELANIDWLTDEGRPAIRFAENPPTRADYPKLGILDSNVRHPVYEKNYAPVKHGAFAIGGHHGGGKKLEGLTLAAWIKPAAEMGQSHHKGIGDIIGYGARRFILSLHNQTAPYKLAARINVNDRIESEAILEADRWYHVAMSAEPVGEHWQVRLYIDGKQVADETTTNFPASSSVPDSLILGAELFYLHSSYYRGLIGRALVLEQGLSDREINALIGHK